MSFEIVIAVLLVLLTLLQTIWRNRVQNKASLQLAWYGVAAALGLQSILYFVNEPEALRVGSGLSGLALVFAVLMIPRTFSGGGTKLI